MFASHSFLKRKIHFKVAGKYFPIVSVKKINSYIGVCYPALPVLEQVWKEVRDHNFIIM